MPHQPHTPFSPPTVMNLRREIARHIRVMILVLYRLHLFPQQYQLIKPTPPSNATMPTTPIQPSTSPTKNTLFPEIVPCSNIQFYDWGDSIGSLPYSLSCRLQGTLRSDSESVVNQIRSGLLWKLISRRLRSQIHVYPVQCHVCPYSTATV